MSNPSIRDEDWGSPGALPSGATGIIINWMLLKGLDDPVLSEAMAFVRGDTALEEAADQLHIWFVERLTVDPGMPDPLGDLGYQLITWALEDVNRGVDWPAIVAALRRDES